MVGGDAVNGGTAIWANGCARPAAPGLPRRRLPEFEFF